MNPHIAVLGAGTMGGGMAELFAANGFDVSLYDPSREALDKARGRLAAAAEAHAGVRKGEAEAAGQTASAPVSFGSVLFTSELPEAVKKADFVLEAGPERLELKRELYRGLSPFLDEDAIVASNTSSLPLESLALGQPFSDRLVIAHFFNPAAVVPLVEVVGLPGTRPGAIGRLTALLESCGKAPVVLRKDCPGFIANRLQAAVLREACHLLDNGVADAEQIDRAMTEGPGIRWALNGPFAIADFGGLDIWERVAANLFPQLDNAAEAPASIRERAQAGQLGVKSGGGFYEYGDAAERERLAGERERKLLGLIARKKEMEQS